MTHPDPSEYRPSKWAIAITRTQLISYRPCWIRRTNSHALQNDIVSHQYYTDDLSFHLRMTGHNRVSSDVVGSHRMSTDIVGQVSVQ